MMRKWPLTLFVLPLVSPAVAQPRDRPTLSEPRNPYRDLGARDVAFPDRQVLDEMTAMRRLGDREGEAITGLSYGCGPVIRPRPGPFE